jgi:hypothetical protein
MYLTAPLSWSEGSARQAPTTRNLHRGLGGDLIRLLEGRVWTLTAPKKTALKAIIQLRGLLDLR